MKVKIRKESIEMRTFFVGLADKLVIIKEETERYSAKAHLTGKKINQLAVDPQNEKQIYAATGDHGLWRTQNGGEHWKRVGENSVLASENITAVVVSPIRRVDGESVVYVGTEPSRLFYSKDAGESWIEFTGIQELPSKANWRFPPRPETHYVRWITPSYSNKEHLALSIEAGAVLHTNDHGQTWQDRANGSPIDVHTLLSHPKKPGYLYAANGDGGSNPQKAYAESPDGGQTWDYKSNGIEEHPYLYNMVLNSNEPEECLVSASKNASQAHRKPRYSTVYRKIKEKAWTEIAEGLPRAGAYTHHLAEDPSTAGAYYAMNNYGIYYLPFGKDHWEKLKIETNLNMFGQRAYSFIVQ